MLLTSLLAAPAWARARVRLDERGEGVVSAAMAAYPLPWHHGTSCSNLLPHLEGC